MQQAIRVSSKALKSWLLEDLVILLGESHTTDNNGIFEKVCPMIPGHALGDRLITCFVQLPSRDFR